MNGGAVSRTPDTWLVIEINSVCRSINIVAHAMETLWLKTEMVLGCFALSVREMFTRQSPKIPQSIDICNLISIGLSGVPMNKGIGLS